MGDYEKIAALWQQKNIRCYDAHDYVTGKAEIDAALEDVAEEVSELSEELRGIPHEKVLIAVACFHAKL